MPVFASHEHYPPDAAVVVLRRGFDPTKFHAPGFSRGAGRPARLWPRLPARPAGVVEIRGSPCLKPCRPAGLGLGTVRDGRAVRVLAAPAGSTSRCTSPRVPLKPVRPARACPRQGPPGTATAGHRASPKLLHHADRPASTCGQAGYYVFKGHIFP